MKYLKTYNENFDEIIFSIKITNQYEFIRIQTLFFNNNIPWNGPKRTKHVQLQINKNILINYWNDNVITYLKDINEMEVSFTIYNSTEIKNEIELKTIIEAQKMRLI